MAKIYRTAVIGRTGRGGYGHHLDAAARTHPRLDVVAVADDDPEGLKKAAARLKLKAAYADYRRMLREVRPAIAVIAPRWVDCHLEMVLAAAEAGASVWMEKPIAPTVIEADRMIEACRRAGVRLAVAHNMRVNPILDWFEARLKDGLIGQLQELRARGKEDRRAGGEDLMVLGTHTFDLMRRFAGDPLWAAGRVSAGGREMRRRDVREGAEGLGLLAGDTVEGMFAFANGLTGYFASKKSDESGARRWGLDLYGSRGVAAIRAAHVPELYLCPSPAWAGVPWQRLEPPPGTPPHDNNSAYHLVIDDLIDAIENGREPRAGGITARWAVEMAHALYISQRTGARVPFPLKRREHPLAG